MGCPSPYDPLDASQYFSMNCAQSSLRPQLGTYVSVHAFTDDAVNRAIDAGAKSIEHDRFSPRNLAADGWRGCLALPASF